MILLTKEGFLVFKLWHHFYAECFIKPGSKDVCVCPLNNLNQKVLAICHDREVAPQLICTEEQNVCKCPMPKNDRVYQIECKKSNHGKF